MSTEALTNRYDMCLIFDVQDGNPNGDPDAGNQPRVDPETLHGLVSDVCQKRKIRDFVSMQFGDKPGMDIFFKHQGILNNQIEEAHENSPEPADKKDKQAKTMSARQWLCDNRYDVRTFGAVLTTGKNAGQVRGPVQCTFARSKDPILTLDACITRKSVTDEKEAKKQIDKKEGGGYITGTMGRKSLIPYGLYKSSWFVNPTLAQQTGFSKADFKILCQALLNMWETDRSAARGMMATRNLFVFEHETSEPGQPALGKAPSHCLLESVKIERKNADTPPRSYDDYDVTLNENGHVQKVKVYDLTKPEDFDRLFAE